MAKQDERDPRDVGNLQLLRSFRRAVTSKAIAESCGQDSDHHNKRSIELEREILLRLGEKLEEGNG